MDAEQTIALQQGLARLQALLEATRQVHATIQMEEVLDRVLRIAVKELEAPGAFVTANPEAMVPERTYGTVPSDLRGKAPSEVGVSLSLCDKEGRTLTNFVVLQRPDNGYSFEELDFLDGLALQAAVAVENARHHEQVLRWQRLQRDLDAARLIQRSLLPQTMPDIPGYDIAARSRACYEVGGDYLDILPTGPQKWVMAVADVAGKGLASALISSSFRSAFRAVATAGMPLDEIAAHLNQLHFAEGEEARRRFVTAAFIRLDLSNNGVEVCNAGHTSGFLLYAGGERQFEASGPPLGLLPRTKYRSEFAELPAGARLLFYSDGLTEVFRGEEEFGPERLLDTFRSCEPNNCMEVLDRIWRELEEFAGAAGQSDDMTALALARHKRAVALEGATA